jgi:hypothetical protein
MDTWIFGAHLRQNREKNDDPNRYKRQKVALFETVPKIFILLQAYLAHF